MTFTPESKTNPRPILRAPRVSAALKAIAEGALVSSEQPPEKIAEQALRVLQLVREENLEYLRIIGVQQRRADRALDALTVIRNKADHMMEIRDGSVIWADWQVVRGYASAAIAAAKGEK